MRFFPSLFDFRKYLIAFALTLTAAFTVYPPDKFISSAQSSTGAESRLKKAVESKSESALLQVERSHPGTTEASLARFLRGYMRLQANDYRTAATLLADQNPGNMSGLGDYALFYRAQALEKAGSLDDSEAEYRRLAGLYPASSLTRSAILQAAGFAMKREDYQRAIDDLAPLVDKNDGTALSRRADALEKLGRRNEAILTLRKLFYDAPQSPEAESAAERLTGLGGSSAPAGASQLRRRADKLYEAGLWVLAVQAYDQIVAQFPDAANDEVRINIGISYYRANSFKQSAEELARVRARTPKLMSDSLYYTGVANLSMHNESAALNALAEMRRSTPGSPRIPQLIYMTGRYHLKRGRETQAAGYYKQLVQQHPESEQAPEAHFWLAWREHENKNYKTSSRMLVEHIANYSDETDNRGKAAFWAAIDTERAGDKAGALTLYRALLRRYGVGWFGTSAERRISRLTGEGVQARSIQDDQLLRRAVIGLQDIYIPNETLNGADLDKVAKAENLMRIAFHQSAMNELEILREKAPKSPLVNLRIAQIFRANGENVAALNALKNAYPDYGQTLPEEMTREVWDVFYPLGWWSVIKEEGNRHSIDPYLIAGVIRQETIFDPMARSRANALGLMQLLPSTGRAVAKSNSLGGSSGITTNDLFNPVLNIQLGTAYLKQLLGRFGRFEYVAAAYNGGPTRVSRWIRELPGDEIEEWVESIPITETRLYVQGVYRNAGHYQRLYDDQGRFRSYVPVR